MSMRKAGNSECSLTADALGIDTFEFDVISDDTSLTEFQRNAPLRYYHGEKLRGTYYVQGIDRIGSDQYRISGDSAVGLLAQRAHPGGIYTGQTVQEVVRDICGAVPVIVESAYADVKLYGWLPYCQPPSSSARDNLVQVLFAIGAYLGTDLNGVLRVEKLWDMGRRRVHRERRPDVPRRQRQDGCKGVRRVGRGAPVHPRKRGRKAV